jgi:hypothetical protein
MSSSLKLKNYLGNQTLEFTRHKQSQKPFVIIKDHGNANSHKSKEVVFLICRLCEPLNNMFIAP